MTGHELIAALQALTPEQLALEVWSPFGFSCRIVEDIVVENYPEDYLELVLGHSP